MQRAFFPFGFILSHGVVGVLADDLHAVAIDALRAAMGHAETLEVNHQQIEVCGPHISQSTRVTDTGELIVEFDLIHPGLADRFVNEAEFRLANEQAQVLAGIARQQRRRR